MQIRFTLTDTYFHSSAAELSNTKQITVEILNTVDANFWNNNACKISKSLKDTVNIDLSNNPSLVEKLLAQNCLAFIVKLNGLYALLYPTLDKSFWGVRLWNTVPITLTKPLEKKKLSPPQLPPSPPLPQLPPSPPPPAIPLHEIDPVQFLADRYCRTLYTHSIVIDHFAKSTIPKMHLLTRHTLQLAKEALSTLAIPTLDALDTRYSSHNPWLLPNESKYRSNLTNIQLESIKSKDIKLQILINLELLTILRKEGTVETEPPQQHQQHHHQQKPLSNIKTTRLRRRRLIPTLLGTALPSMPDFDSDLRQLSNTHPIIHSTSATSRLIASLFDRLCIDDAVLGLEYHDTRSAWSFLTTVVTPFHANKHSKLLKQLAISARGPSVLLKLKNRQIKKRLTDNNNNNNNKKLSNSQKVPQRKQIDLSQLKLSRSHSNLSTSTADLARKTFSLDEPDNSITPIPLTSPARFMNSKKRKLVVPTHNNLQLPPPPSSSSFSSSPPPLSPPPPPPLLFHPNQTIEATPCKEKSIQTPKSTRQIILSPTPKRKLTFN